MTMVRSRPGGMGAPHMSRLCTQSQHTAPRERTAKEAAVA
eukprot:CAMPEP_0178444868 /NCGR_PEP_ID=MMETSP0689_2-20121128/39803_1 /TAXON_ID=160604 /ORGANISM="Amphidinium massartii, Strain CS-259" /LENGTH=39 /DNA_ID= /DNA_START= /DNA_END= /DNA_ORIENTATION=